MLLALLLGTASASADRHQRVERLQRALDHLVEVKGGPPGASAVLYRGGRERFLRAGVADVDTEKPFRRQKHMRIASVSKAFSGAVALSLVDDGVLGLDDSVTAWVPQLPAHWSAGHPAPGAQPHRRAAQLHQPTRSSSTTSATTCMARSTTWG